MMIVLLIALGISFLCAVTEIGACVISGQNRHVTEEYMASQEDEQWQSTKSSTKPSTKSSTKHLSTTSTPLA